MKGKLKSILRYKSDVEYSYVNIIFFPANLAHKNQKSSKSCQGSKKNPLQVIDSQRVYIRVGDKRPACRQAGAHSLLRFVASAGLNSPPLARSRLPKFITERGGESRLPTLPQNKTAPGNKTDDKQDSAPAYRVHLFSLKSALKISTTLASL